MPKGQVSALTNNLSGYRMYDGFLIPKDTKDEQAYDAAPSTLPGITYLLGLDDQCVAREKRRVMRGVFRGVPALSPTLHSTVV